MQATIKTNKGDIKLDLFADKAKMTVSNFVNLSKRGFYNKLTFHRVIDAVSYTHLRAHET